MSNLAVERGGDIRDLRNALGCFATGVTVVTTRALDGVPYGLTANSFSSVSLDPPIVLWSLSKRSPSMQAFVESGRFVINVLALEQIHLSKNFSSKIPDKFSGVDCQDGIGGIPVINGCAANIECKVSQYLDIGDHVLFLGEIERYHYESKPTLLFCHGNYQKAVEVNLENQTIS